MMSGVRWSGLADEAFTSRGVGIAFEGVGFCQQVEEGFVAGERSEIGTAFLDTHGAAAFHAVGIDECEVEPIVPPVVENVTRRKVAMQETVFVESGSKACKVAHDFLPFGQRKTVYVGHAVTIVGVETNEIRGRREPSPSVFYPCDGLRAFKASLAQEQGIEKSALGFRRLVKLIGDAPSQGRKSVVLHAKRQVVHTQCSYHVTAVVNLVAVAFKVLVDVR